MKNMLPIIIVVLGLIISGIIIFTSNQGQFINQTVSLKEAGEIATKFMNEKLLQGQGSVSLKGVSEEAGLYKIDFSYQGQNFSVYISKDGKKFFGQGWDIENFEMPTLPSGGTVGGCSL